MTVIYNPASGFTRPNNTTAYASGQLVANATTAGSVVPMSFALQAYSVNAPFVLKRVRLAKSGTSAANAAFRAHFYASLPTPANGDGGAWSTDQAANYLGSVDIASMKSFTDGCCDVGSYPTNTEASVRLPAGTKIYSLLEARGAYAPAANEVFTLTLELL
jgi:hypothetical protein